MLIPSSRTNRAALGLAASVALLLVSTDAQAVTIAQWDFEDGVAGQEFTPVGQPNASGGSVDTVSGILMRGFNEAFGPTFATSSGAAAGLAMGLDVGVGPNVTSDGFVTEGALHNWSPTAWTIETTVFMNVVTGWNTFIGRDGSSQAEPESDFYLVNNGIDDQFRINFDTVGGQRWVLDGAPVGGAQPGTWYGLAARSDGTTLSLWLDDGFTGYQQIGSLDISAQTPANNALPGTALNWTFGRGWFNGGFVDHVNGKMDNIRFSDVALAPSELIPLDVSSVSLIVDPATGDAILKNETGSPIAMDYYRIDSATAGVLLTGNYNGTTGWNSLSDQGIDPVTGGNDPGETWDEATGANSANLLVEQFLLGNTTLAGGSSVSLGAPVNPSLLNEMSSDLQFRYASPGGVLTRAKVRFQSLDALTGDANGDGSVDLLDLDTLGAHFGAASGATVAQGDFDANGAVNQADLQILDNNFGAGASSAAAVPEPATAIVAMLGFASLVGLRRFAI